MRDSRRLILALSTDGNPVGGELRVMTESMGRLTTALLPSIAAWPHIFAIHLLRQPKEPIDPALSKSKQEREAKAEAVRHRLYWGHRELNLTAEALAASVPPHLPSLPRPAAAAAAAVARGYRQCSPMATVPPPPPLVQSTPPSDPVVATVEAAAAAAVAGAASETPAAAATATAVAGWVEQDEEKEKNDEEADTATSTAEAESLVVAARAVAEEANLTERTAAMAAAAVQAVAVGATVTESTAVDATTAQAAAAAAAAAARLWARRWRGAVLVDRDGVLTEAPAYNTGPAALRLVPGAAVAVARLRAAGLRVGVVSNQGCVGKGYVTTTDAHAVMDRMCRLLRDELAADITTAAAATAASASDLAFVPGAAAVEASNPFFAATSTSPSAATAKKNITTTAAVADAADRNRRAEGRPQVSACVAGSDAGNVAQPDCIVFSVGTEDGPAVTDAYANLTDAKPRPAGLLRALDAMFPGANARAAASAAARGEHDAAERARRDAAAATRRFMVGDRLTDLRAGAAAGCDTVLVRSGRGRDEEARLRACSVEGGGGEVGSGAEDLRLVGVVDDVAAAADLILGIIGPPAVE